MTETAVESATVPLAGDRIRNRRLPSGRALAVVAGVLYLPLTGLGYGTDVDITNIRRAGESLLDGHYRYSRPPGALAYEALVGVLDRIGGPLAVNLASTAAAVALLAGVATLAERLAGRRAGQVAVAVVATQPWFIVAATSLGDYLFALSFLLLGVLSAQRDHRVLAGVAFAAAAGFRVGTVLLAGAWLATELTGTRSLPAPDGPGRRPWKPVLITGAVTGVLGALWFIPPWLSAGRTRRFLLNEFETSTPLVQVGRWGIKNIGVFGIATLVVVLVASPVLLRVIRKGWTNPAVRFAVFVCVVSELLFLRFPWKPVHLLPAVVGLALVVAVGGVGRGLVVSLVAANLLLAVVSVTVAEPDVVDASTTGRLHLGFTRGVLLNDVDCRLHPRHEGTWPDLALPEADYAAIDAFTCQARSWRADPP